MGFEQGSETFGVPEAKYAAGWVVKSFFQQRMSAWNSLSAL